MEFTADQIIGKTLIAKIPVKITRVADDNANIIFTAEPGESIGVVQSYLLPGTNRKTLYWVFKDSNGRFYYTSHKPGKFNIEALQAEGALTLQQQQAAAEEKNKTLSQRIFASIQNLALIGAGAYIIANYFKSRK